ncbi:unnamed protein product, partial [Heterosigma akashiwo]
HGHTGGARCRGRPLGRPAPGVQGPERAGLRGFCHRARAGGAGHSHGGGALAHAQVLPLGDPGRGHRGFGHRPAGLPWEVVGKMMTGGQGSKKQLTSQ